MSPSRKHKLTRRLLPVVFTAAAIGGFAVAGPRTPTDQAECGVAEAAPGQDPITTVHFAALAAQHAKPTGHHYRDETPAGNQVDREWQQVHPGEPFQPGALVEAYVRNDHITAAHLVAAGSLGCGEITPSPAS